MELKRKIIAAFTLGYFLSVLRQQLLIEKSSFGNHRHSMIIFLHREIVLTASDLIKEVFEEEILSSPSIKSLDDLKNFLDEVFKIVSEKIQRGGESFLEISFYSGGVLGFVESLEETQFDQRKLLMIIYELLQMLGINTGWIELERIVTNLTSHKTDSRRRSRNELFTMICSAHANYKKVFDIQHAVEDPPFFWN
ncbi:MAG: hypothetical protein AB1298_03505 [Bacteroidota bacterium]